MKRALLPSIADLLFIGLLLTRVQPTLFHDGDTGWHLWAGTAVFSHGPGAIADSQSYTRAGSFFENVEWLGEAIMALVHRHAGYLGLGILAGVVFAGTFSWLYRILLRESRDPVASVLVTVLAAQVTLLQFLARPLIFSFPLFLGTIELARGPGRRALIGLPLLTALWANIHPSATLAPAISLFFWLRAPKDRDRGLATLMAWLALGATPWGFGWVGGMLAENRDYFGKVEEWASPTFGEWRFAPYLLGILLAVLARRGAPPLPVSGWVWGVGWLGAALLSARLGPYAFLAWAPYLARDLAQGDLISLVRPLHRLWSGLREGLGPMEATLRPRLWPVAVGFLALALAPRLGALFPGAAAGFPSERFPKAALLQAEQNRLGPHVFCDYAWGGYVGWEARGRYQVYIDGRAGFFGSELLMDYLTIYTAASGWEAALDRHPPDWILISPDAPLLEAASRGSQWRVVHQDATSVLLVPARS